MLSVLSSCFSYLFRGITIRSILCFVHSHEIMLEVLVPYNFLMLMFWSLVFELLKLI